jgi:hypothetical protein
MVSLRYDQKPEICPTYPKSIFAFHHAVVATVRSPKMKPETGRGRVAWCSAN